MQPPAPVQSWLAPDPDRTISSRGFVAFVVGRSKGEMISNQDWQHTISTPGYCRLHKQQNRLRRLCRGCRYRQIAADSESYADEMAGRRFRLDNVSESADAL